MNTPSIAEAISLTLAEPFGSFSAILSRWAEAQGDKPALLDETTSLSWGDLNDRVERLAARMVETGLKRGQSVAILGLSTVNYALVFLAAVRAGGVAAPLTTSASPEQLVGMATDSGARHLFIDAGKAAELGADFMPDLEHVALEKIDAWMAPEGTETPEVGGGREGQGRRIDGEKCTNESWN